MNLFFKKYCMASKMDVVLLQSVRGLWNKNDLVSVSVAYAKNVLFPKWQAKMADAIAKNNLAQKQEQQKKYDSHVSEIRDKIVLYAEAKEPLVIKRKVTPSAKLYEKVREVDVKEALQQWEISLPSEIVVEKAVRDEVWAQEALLSFDNKKTKIQFTIKEIF